MGQDKALKPFLGRPLIQRVIERVSPIAAEILVTANRPAAYAFLKLPIQTDLKPGRGPLGGLYTALASASNSVVAVVACDMPFASADLFQTAADILLREGVDVVIASTSEGFEPLHAVYRRAACVQAVEAAIAADQWKMVAWFGQVKVRTLTAEEIKRSDPEGLAFWNVNTPEEFAKAEAIASGRSAPGTVRD
jgi:molybdopterin-guanine dinucleotide biosynthesis protein A